MYLIGAWHQRMLKATPSPGMDLPALCRRHTWGESVVVGRAWILFGNRKTRSEENAFPFRVVFQLVDRLPLTLLFIGGALIV
jgi:hypothetical protein